MAELELHRLMDEAATAKPKADAHTFGEACGEWLRWLGQERGAAQTTIRNNRSAVSSRLEPFFGKDTPLADVTTETIDAYRADALVKRRLAPSTVLRDLTNLSGIFRRSVRLKWITENPYADSERIQVKASGDFNVLSVEQIEATARAAASDQDASLYRVAAYTGLRQGELRALRWRDIDFAGATIHLKRNLPANGDETMPKGKVVRSVPMIDQAAAALDGLSRRGYLGADDDHVFVSVAGGAVDDTDMRDGFYAALKAAGLGHLRQQDDPIVFHDLRHTFATLAVQVWPLVDVQAYMGHQNIATTMRYSHHVKKTDAAERFSQFVASELCPEVCPEPMTSGTTQRNSAQLRAA